MNDHGDQYKKRVIKNMQRKVKQPKFELVEVLNVGNDNTAILLNSIRMKTVFFVNPCVR